MLKRIFSFFLSDTHNGENVGSCFTEQPTNISTFPVRKCTSVHPISVCVQKLYSRTCQTCYYHTCRREIVIIESHFQLCFLLLFTGGNAAFGSLTLVPDWRTDKHTNKQTYSHNTGGLNHLFRRIIFSILGHGKWFLKNCI